MRRMTWRSMMVGLTAVCLSAVSALGSPTRPLLEVAGGAALAQPGRGEAREVRLYEVGDLSEVARLDRLAGALGMPYESVSKQIAAVTGSAEQHGAFEAALRTVRATPMAARVSVEIEARRGSGAAPIAGSKAAGDWTRVAPTHSARTVVRIGRVAEVSSIETITYVRSLIPVVGTQSAAYQTDVHEAESGIELSIMVDSVREGGAVVFLNGKLSLAGVASLPSQGAPPRSDIAGWAVAPAPLQQLRHRTRQVNAEVDAGAEPIVAAVVDDLEGEGWLAITVRVISAP